MPDGSVLAAMAADGISVDKLVQEFLGAQSLKILPQTRFGEVVTDFVNEKDKHIVEDFVEESLATQVNEILKMEDDDQEEMDLDPIMELVRKKQEASHSAKNKKPNRVLKPRPLIWDSDQDGEWEDSPNAYEVIDDKPSMVPSRRRSIVSSAENDDAMSDIALSKKIAKKTPQKRAPAKPRAAAKAKAPAKTKVAAKAPTRGRRKAAEPSDDEVDDDIIMQEDSPPQVVKSQPKRAAATKGRQTQLNFSQSQPSKTQTHIEISDDEISEDDVFAPVASSSRRR
jgi:double-strand break repair protein MRE11